MAHHIPGIPIVVPGTTTTTGHAQSGVVWAGKPLTDDKDSVHEEREELATPPAKKMALDMNSGVVTLANRLPPGIGNFIVTPGQHPSSPQLIQMTAPGQPPQIPIVIPAPLPARANGQKEVVVHGSPKRTDTHHELAETIANYPPSLARTPHSATTQFTTPDVRPPSESRSVEAAEERSPNRTKMPFANISIKSGMYSAIPVMSLVVVLCIVT